MLISFLLYCLASPTVHVIHATNSFGKKDNFDTYPFSLSTINVNAITSQMDMLARKFLRSDPVLNN